MSDSPLARRCGTCVRFVRVIEVKGPDGSMRRAGECLLGVWPSPLYEANTCSQHVTRGQAATELRRPRPSSRQRSGRRESSSTSSQERKPLQIPEELLDMDASEFREVLREVLRDELGVSATELGPRWQGGELIMKPGKEGTAEKRVPLEAFFRKIVTVRDKLRVLEQKINSHPKLSDEDKVTVQQYITQCYGSLTTFNVLFGEKSEFFVGQKGDKED